MLRETTITMDEHTFALLFELCPQTANSRPNPLEALAIKLLLALDDGRPQFTVSYPPDQGSLICPHCGGKGQNP